MAPTNIFSGTQQVCFCFLFFRKWVGPGGLLAVQIFFLIVFVLAATTVGEYPLFN